jgi:UrcA family protein
MSKFTNIAAPTLTGAASLFGVFALITAVSLAFSTARADEAPPSRTVGFADLNLSTEAGAAALYRRIQAAARSVCPGDDTTPELERIAARHRCIEDAVTRAVRKVNIESLSAYYTTKTGHLVANLAANPGR